jgi:protein-L-isoaspartate(D-aspartate) O-methyltransferase
MFQNKSVSDVRNSPSSIVSLWIGLFTLSCCCHLNPVHAAENFSKAHRQLVQVIEEDVRSTSYYLNKEALDPRVMKAMGRVPRHEFVPVVERPWAYLNRPLPIGHGQTISQPYIVAVMTDLLKVTPKSKVLEVGTGSGYQAAILSELVDKVFTIEIIKPLGEQAGKRLARLGYDNVQVRIGDGYSGWAEEAPYDAIVVTAAASHVPPPLIRQLKVGGIMVIPVGSPFMTQELLLVRKEAGERTTIRQILPVMFVPLTGEH